MTHPPPAVILCTRSCATGGGIGGFLSNVTHTVTDGVKGAMGAVRDEIQADIKPSLKDDPAPADAADAAAAAAPAK